MADNLRFSSNNVNGLRSSKKHVKKLFEYLKCQIVNNVIIFLKETHSSEKTFFVGQNDFKREIFFLMVQHTSCGVTIGYLGNKKLLVNKICKDNKGRIL